MIIRSSKSLKRYDTKVENEVVVKQEEVKPLDKEIIQKPKKKKITPTPIAEEPVEVVEEKVEDEDLSKWLEEHTED